MRLRAMRSRHQHIGADMTDDTELAAIRARVKSSHKRGDDAGPIAVDRRTLLRKLRDARAASEHREELDAFTKPLSCSQAEPETNP